ncbi:MAG: primosomal protein N', partial [Alphaproteobacteria bacterium]|nr:primosomal protein N' [Alphaproteobacteria bacterium]
MSQTSLLPTALPEARHRVQVLAPAPLARAYDYAVPEGMAVEAGDYVRVPLGRREMFGVVWDGNADDDIPATKIKSVLQKYDLPSLPAGHRAFIDKVAAYTMADLGSVLKMTLSAPDAFDPPAPATGYVRGKLPEKLTAARQKVWNVLQDGVPMRAVDIPRECGVSAAT